MWIVTGVVFSVLSAFLVYSSLKLLKKDYFKMKEKYEDKRRFKIVNVSFDFTAPDTGALRDIIFFVETRTPYLVIKELDCRVRNFREPRELMVKLDVSALYGGK